MLTRWLLDVSCRVVIAEAVTFWGASEDVAGAERRSMRHIPGCCRCGTKVADVEVAGDSIAGQEEEALS